MDPPSEEPRMEEEVEEMDDEEEEEEEEVEDEEEEVEEEEEEEEGDHLEVTVGRRSGRGLTLKTLLKERVLEPGEGSMTINYLGNKFKGDLLPDGRIRSQETNKIFGTPSAWAIYCKKIVNPDKKSGCGWASISKIQMDRILHYIETGIQEGAKLECGGKRKGNKGYFIEPTVFSGVTDDMTIAKEEIFGPVQIILKFKTMEEVIERSNNTHYGLAAGILSRNLNKVMLFSQSVRAGSVWINSYDLCLPQTPFGGYKQSGQGKELGEEGLYEYLETKTITMKVSAKL